jgi:prevent-host-death family protein
MKTISMVEFRHHAEKIISRVQKGQRLILTRYGKPVARLEPIIPRALHHDVPFYSLDQLSDAYGAQLTNAQIDHILCGQ